MKQSVDTMSHSLSFMSQKYNDILIELENFKMSTVMKILMVKLRSLSFSLRPISVIFVISNLLDKKVKKSRLMMFLDFLSYFSNSRLVILKDDVRKSITKFYYYIA